jgi:hypothetical protein
VFAMQKVEGSSLFIRLKKSLGNEASSCATKASGRRDAAGLSGNQPTSSSTYAPVPLTGSARARGRGRAC